jgi:hypothetical protein
MLADGPGGACDPEALRVRCVGSDAFAILTKRFLR